MRLSIVAHNAYGMISDNISGHIGGVERQTVLMARWLASRGHEVSLVTWDEGGGRRETIDNVDVIKTCRRSAGLPITRFIVPRWTSLNRALRDADADIYYQNGAEYVTGQVALWCRRHGRKFVFSAASDKDCRDWIISERSVRERWLYRLGLRLADSIIVQSRKQATLLESTTGLRSAVLPMPCNEFPPWEKRGSPGVDVDTPLFLLVGRVAPEKDVAMYIELANRMPDARFLVVGPMPDNDPYAREVRELASQVANVELFGAANREQLNELYRSATALCCTSVYEGFPNTFIEAWSVGLPVVSTVDPDGVIDDYDLGTRVTGVDTMVAALRTLADSRERRAALSANSLEYFRRTHAVDAAMGRFERLFLELA